MTSQRRRLPAAGHLRFVLAFLRALVAFGRAARCTRDFLDCVWAVYGVLLLLLHGTSVPCIFGHAHRRRPAVPNVLSCSYRTRTHDTCFLWPSSRPQRRHAGGGGGGGPGRLPCASAPCRRMWQRSGVSAGRTGGRRGRKLLPLLPVRQQRACFYIEHTTGLGAR